MGLEQFISALQDLGIPVSTSGFEDHLTDESRFRGTAQALIYVRDRTQVPVILRFASINRVKITVVSGKTSITGSSVPTGGVILDLKALNAVDPSDPTIVEPGIVTKHYHDYVDELGLFFPPDPTSEDSCTIGGNVACNASGALSYFYGPTRDYVRGLTVALSTGSVLRIDRGEVVGAHGRITIPRQLLTPSPAEDLVVPIPRHAGPPWELCKSAVGLYADDPMDLVDLFVGSEGILGVLLEVRTILRPRRNPYAALMLYLPSREITVDIVKFLDGLKSWSVKRNLQEKERAEQALKTLIPDVEHASLEDYDEIVPTCMEWLGSSTAPFLAGERAERLRKTYGCVYVEQEYCPDQDPFTVLGQWAELVEAVNRYRTNGHDIIHTETALDENQIRRMRQERKIIPEKLNELIRPGLVKIGMDFAVPKEQLGRLTELYDRLLPSGTSYVFGHIGNAHLHVNLLPENAEEERYFQEIYRSVAREVCALGGTVSAEHGIGKLKHEALEMMLGVKGAAEIVQIKRIFDPACILNVGNMVKADLMCW